MPSAGPSVVVPLAQDNLMGAEQLLQPDHASKLMGQRDRAQRNALLDAGEHALGEAERAADHETDVPAGAPAFPEPSSDRLARAQVTFAVQRTGVGIGRDPPQDRLCLAARIGLRKLDRLEAGVAAQEALVVCDVVLERRANLSDTYQDQ